MGPSATPLADGVEASMLGMRARRTHVHREERALVCEAEMRLPEACRRAEEHAQALRSLGPLHDSSASVALFFWRSHAPSPIRTADTDSCANCQLSFGLERTQHLALAGRISRDLLCWPAYKIFYRSCACLTE